MTSRPFLAVFFVAFLVTGCTRIESGFKYEYEGRLLRPDGKTPVNNVAVRLARVDAPGAPDLPPKMAKKAGQYTDKQQKSRSGKDGRFHGVLETKKGWAYTDVSGVPVGPTRPPDPPPLGEVILYVQQHGQAWIGYRLPLPPESQSEAHSGIRKLHLPDVLIAEKPATTRSATQPTTAP